MAFLAGCSSPAGVPSPRKRLLVITETVEYRHGSIPFAVEAVRSLGNETTEWEITDTADTADQVRALMTTEKLSAVDAVVFASTTGTLSFSQEGRTAFYEWMRNGGAYIGIHSASDTFHGDADYLDLLGGEFLTHGPQTEVEIFVQDRAHPACAGLPDSFTFFEEIYEFKGWSRAAVHMLLAMHHHPQEGTPGDFPVAWTRRYGQGRVFYTSLGHRDDTYANELFRKHLRGGIQWALGLKAGDDTHGNPII